MRDSRIRWAQAGLLVAGAAVFVAMGCGVSRPRDGAIGSGGASGSSGTGGMAEPMAPTFVDGTRLVARTYSFPGTAPLFVGIYDRQEHVACEFRAATDGNLRCLPARKPGVADPEPADRWQEGTEVLGPATGLRLRPYRLVSPDGGAFPDWISGELADEMYGKPCRPDTTREPDGNGVGACLPEHALLNGAYFGDAGCTLPLAVTTGAGAMPLLISTSERKAFALGEKFMGATFIQYGMNSASCMPFSTGAEPIGEDFYRVGDQLPVEAVAAVRITPRGVGRLALQTVESQGAGLAHVRHHALTTPSAGDGPYFDRELGILCRPTWTLSGELRCVPDDAYYAPETWLTNFADPACTQPVISQKESAAVVLRADAASERQVVVEVRRVASDYTKTAYTRKNDPTGACTEFLKGAGYPLGDIIPMDSFAVVEAHGGEP